MSRSSRRVRVSAPGKINLSLRVGGRDERGYHALATVFQALSLRETVTVQETPGERQFSLTVDSYVDGDVPIDSSNLAVRAGELLRSAYGITAGAHLHIDKRVPIAGGMGGGSADAAAALVALNHLWGEPATRDELMTLGAQLGADVPFAILGGTALGMGNGADLSPLSDIGAGGAGHWHWVLAIPGGILSTPAVYQRFDELAARRAVAPAIVPSADEMQIAALAAGDHSALARSLANDLQDPALTLHDGLQSALDACATAGAVGAIVSGSGPTLMLLASDADHADELAARLTRSGAVRAAHVATGPDAGAILVD